MSVSCCSFPFPSATSGYSLLCQSLGRRYPSSLYGRGRSFPKACGYLHLPTTAVAGATAAAEAATYLPIIRHQAIRAEHSWHFFSFISLQLRLATSLTSWLTGWLNVCYPNVMSCCQIKSTVLAGAVCLAGLPVNDHLLVCNLRSHQTHARTHTQALALARPCANPTVTHIHIPVKHRPRHSH